MKTPTKQTNAMSVNQKNKEVNRESEGVQQSKQTNACNKLKTIRRHTGEASRVP
jgi:hypothetical protein